MRPGYARRRMQQLAMGRLRERAEHPPSAVEVPAAPTAYTGRVVHLASEGWKAAREFTACGRKARDVTAAPTVDLVTCPRCREIAQEREARRR